MGGMPPLERVTFTSKYVRLEPLTLSHAEDLAAISNDPDLWRYMSFWQYGTMDDPGMPEAMFEWVAETESEPERGTGLPFVMIDLASGRVAGSISLYDMNWRHQRVELGRTWLGKAFQRTGLNTETKLFLLTHAFEVLKVRRVTTKAGANNVRSRQSIERMGSTFEGILRNFFVMRDGTSADVAMYAITREDWPGVKKRIQSKLS